jgi:uncharacterized membrane protein YcaP (DUF421 family)
MEKDVQTFDWHRIFTSDDAPITYVAEIVFRTFVMFLILIIALKLLSKRGVKQLSVFELAILIALGSAIGDPMFYHHVPVTYGAVVLVVVIFIYKVITSLTARYKLIEEALEGKPILLLEDGLMQYDNYKTIGLPYDKFFAELRLQSIDHLGQVRKAYLETSGEISVYFFEDDQVREGLPIYPEAIKTPVTVIDRSARHACIYCGNVQHITQPNDRCAICENDKWIVPDSRPRVR